MSASRYLRAFAAVAFLALLSGSSASAQNSNNNDNWNDNPYQIKHVFVIAEENHNWTQPATIPGGINPIFQNPNAPFINSLVNGTAQAYIDGRLVNISEQVAYATAYHNVLATPSGNNPHIHPSEPNYLWAEAGTNFGILDDDDPYADNPPNAQSTQNLSGLLQRAGYSWKSYQEDIDLTKNSTGQLINLPLDFSQWTVPLVSQSGLFGPGNYLNAYNNSIQYNYAVKHNPEAFFTATNGGNNSTTSNRLRFNYAPLQQLAFDLQSDNVANYNWITPDQYNEMHSSLNPTFIGLASDESNIRSGDNTLSRLIPLIMASRAYKDGGLIIIWWDETEDTGAPGDNQDDFTHTLGEILISPLARENQNGVPYSNAINYSHSSDLRTMQEIFHVKTTGRTSPFLGDAANATDLSDLFKPGVIPTRP